MGRPREFDEAAVLGDALEVFWANGYNATSIQNLVEATGLERGSLYGAFGNKHSIYLLALDGYIEGALAELRKALASHSDPMDGVRGMIRAAASDSTGPRAWMGCMVGSAASEMAAHDEPSRRRLQAFVSSLRKLVADAVRRSQAAGKFPADRDPKAVATFVHCNIQGLKLLGKAEPKPKVVKGVVAEILRALA